MEEAIDWFDDLDVAASRADAQLLPLLRDRTDPEPPWLNFPHLEPIRSMQRWSRYRASAAIGCLEKEKARLSLTSGFRLVQASGSEPTSPEHLTTLTMALIIIRPVWDSLHGRIWSDAELQWLDSEIAQIDIITNYRRCLQAETAFSATAIDHIKTSPNLYREFLGNKAFVKRLLFSAIPNGHVDLKKARHVQNLARLQDALHSDNFTTVKTELESLTADPKKGPPNLLGMLDDMSMFRKTTISTAVVHTQVQQARLAITLERYYLKHHRYPKELNSLIPRSLSDFVKSGPQLWPC